MSENQINTTPSKASKIFYWIAVVILFLTMVQPTVDNIKAGLSGQFVMGTLSMEASLTDMLPHYVGAIMGWLGWWWFFKRQKKGAYLSVAAHFIGLGGVYAMVGDKLFEFMPAPVLGVFFLVVSAVALGPTIAFKQDYT